MTVAYASTEFIKAVKSFIVQARRRGKKSFITSTPGESEHPQRPQRRQQLRRQAAPQFREADEPRLPSRGRRSGRGRRRDGRAAGQAHQRPAGSGRDTTDRLPVRHRAAIFRGRGPAAAGRGGTGGRGGRRDPAAVCSGSSGS
jgi:hypothetical protein